MAREATGPGHQAGRGPRRGRGARCGVSQGGLRRTGLIWTKSSATGYAPELIGAVHTSFYWGVSTEAQREHSG
jgi:hypothetical protein